MMNYQASALRKRKVDQVSRLMQQRNKLLSKVEKLIVVAETLVERNIAERNTVIDETISEAKQLVEEVKREWA